MSDYNELQSAVDEYLSECDEILRRVSSSFSQIENSSDVSETIDSLYRDIHTLKGSSQLFGFNAIGDVAHALETSMDPIRKNKITPSKPAVDAYVRCIDVIDLMVCAIRDKKEEDFSDRVKAALQQLAESSVEAKVEAAPVVASSLEIPDLSKMNEVPPFVQSEFSAADQPPTDQPLQPPKEEDEMESFFCEMPDSSETAATLLAGEPEVISAPVVSEPVVVVESTPIPETQPAVAHPAPTGSSDPSESSTIRVPVSLLDKLMTLMGEMVLVRNQVQQYAGNSDDLGFVNLSQRLDIVTSDIQGEVMKTRMQPIGNVLSKFQRVVRDLARDLNKKVDLTLVGAETELDKTLLEAVKDPIMHIVRNSCDHGIETPEERRAGKKAEMGHLTIRSFHEGGQVIVEVSDDGRGLAREKLISKAIEKGLLTPEKAAACSDQDAHNLIFAPGFSTAKNVTNVSGRGVGMDVVKNNIEGIGGMVELESKQGHGTTIRLKIPLTLAIVPTMIVRSGSEQFAIPQVKLVELVRVEKGSGTSQVEYLQGQPVYRLRGDLLPLVRLNEVLGNANASRSKSVEDVTNIVVLKAERRMFGLIVDEVQDTAEVVVKPLSSFIKSVSVYSGATVLGDGSIALILDVVGIAHSRSMIGDTSTATADEKENEQAIISETQEFLSFRLNSPTKYAIPLNLVHRLEEFKRSNIEYSGEQRVIRYRDTILPIISLNDSLGFKGNDSSETLSIIVTRKASKLYGIEVDEILDVVATTAPMDEGLSDRPGILGNLISSGEVTVIVDSLQILDHFVSKTSQKSGDPSAKAKAAEKFGLGKKILLVEDTVFFRKHIQAVLQRAGFEVNHAENGAEALKVLENSPRNQYDLVLSDIEMPKMNGIELAKAIRKNSVWNAVPLLAITTRYNDEHVAEGIAAGFDSYLEKLKPEVLLGAIQSKLNDGSKGRIAS